MKVVSDQIIARCQLGQIAADDRRAAAAAQQEDSGATAGSSAERGGWLAPAHDSAVAMATATAQAPSGACCLPASCQLRWYECTSCSAVHCDLL
jgi:hypothetical protein